MDTKPKFFLSFPFFLSSLFSFFSASPSFLTLFSARNPLILVKKGFVLFCFAFSFLLVSFFSYSLIFLEREKTMMGKRKRNQRLFFLVHGLPLSIHPPTCTQIEPKGKSPEIPRETASHVQKMLVGLSHELKTPLSATYLNFDGQPGDLFVAEVRAGGRGMKNKISDNFFSFCFVFMFVSLDLCHFLSLFFLFSFLCIFSLFSILETKRWWLMEQTQQKKWPFWFSPSPCVPVCLFPHFPHIFSFLLSLREQTFWLGTKCAQWMYFILDMKGRVGELD